MSTPVDGIVELTLQTAEPARLARFYVDVVGLEELSREEDRIWLKVCDTCRLGLWSPGRKEFDDQGGRHVHFAFSTPPGELDALADRLGAAGAEVRGPVGHDGGDRSVYLTDPEGNVVEFWDFLHRAPGRRAGTDALG